MASFFKSFLFPTVNAQVDEEEEIVCPQAELRESCNQKPKLLALYAIYQECNDRVNAKKATAETCAEELHDYIHELDHCVNKTLFSKLK